MKPPGGEISSCQGIRAGSWLSNDVKDFADLEGCYPLFCIILHIKLSQIL